MLTNSIYANGTQIYNVIHFKYLSVTPGRMKNIQKCIPNTSTTWKTHFPSRDFFRYSARSTIMVPNWMSSMTRKASGT